MSINLSIQFNHPDAIANRVRYARIDNVVTPNFITVSPDPTTSPATIATNIPNGQYRIESIPIYADGRICGPTTIDTPACPGLLSINASIDSGNLIVQYLAPSEVPKVRITVGYPNGGSFVANYVNNGNNIVIALPPNLDGDYTVIGQSVCDEDSGFYSPFSSQVVVTRSTTNVTLTSSAGGITVTNVQGIDGFTMPGNLTPGNTITGQHNAFFSAITFTWTGTPVVSSSATLSVNGTPTQCVNIPNSSGGSASFNSASFAASDIIRIDFNTGTCP